MPWAHYCHSPRLAPPAETGFSVAAMLEILPLIQCLFAVFLPNGSNSAFPVPLSPFYPPRPWEETQPRRLVLFLPCAIDGAPCTISDLFHGFLRFRAQIDNAAAAAGRITRHWYGADPGMVVAAGQNCVTLPSQSVRPGSCG